MERYLWVICAIVVWIGCGIIAVGTTVAYFQRSYPELAAHDYKNDLRTAISIGMMGPLSMIITYFLSGYCKQGWYIFYRDLKVKDEPK